MDLDFLCIGVQKAGTTWLDRMLRSHRVVWMPVVKELHYYDEMFLPFVRSWSGQHRLKNGADVIRWQEESGRPDPRIIREAKHIARETVDAQWYRDLFDMAPAGMLKGEITPEYSLLPLDGIELVRSDNPRAHYFIMLREPVSRDLSHIRMILANEGFQSDAPTATYEHRFETYLNWLAHEKRGEYLPLLERWQSLIAPDRFHVLFFEQIRSSPEQLLRTVCDTLGIPTEGVSADMHKVVHEGKSFDIPDWVVETLRARHEKALESLRRDFGMLQHLW